MTPKAHPAKAAFVIASPKDKLLDQLREILRVKHSLGTEEAYVLWARRFLKFHRDRTGGWKHPGELGATEVGAFLNHFANVEHVAAATQNQALNAIVFLYKASKPRRDPVVLSREESRSDRADDGRDPPVLEFLRESTNDLQCPSTALRFKPLAAAGLLRASQARVSARTGPESKSQRRGRLLEFDRARSTRDSFDAPHARSHLTPFQPLQRACSGQSYPFSLGAKNSLILLPPSSAKRATRNFELNAY